MTTSEIISAIRRGTREPKPKDISNTVISESIDRGIDILGMKLKKYSPLSLKERVSVSSDTNVFDFPSTCDVLLRVWDLDTNAKSITGATNATPIVVTSVAHGFSDDEIVFIHDVVGITEANGTWKVANKAADTFELYGSAGTTGYTSGGKVFEENEDFLRLTRMPESEAELDDDTKWFLRNEQIVVNDPDFTNDILISYTASVAALTNVPAKYHTGLVAFGVIELIKIPHEDAKTYKDLSQSLKWHLAIWETIVEDIGHGSGATVEPSNISDVTRIKRFI